MASVEYIEKRIAGKEAEITKLQKKLERINKAEATGWEVNPYYYSEHDKRYATKDLEAAVAALEKYKADLVIAKEKEGSRNVPAILEFLENWKKRVTEYYGSGLKEYFAEKEAIYKLYEASHDYNMDDDERRAARAKYEAANEAFMAKKYGYTEEREYTWKGRVRKERVKVRDGEYEYLRPYSGERTEAEAMSKLAKDLVEEAKRKYDFIIERTNAIVGKITDASELAVGAKGDLNGFVVGTNGVAKVQTIGAGGWNIQCFHFRTLIHKA